MCAESILFACVQIAECLHVSEKQIVYMCSEIRLFAYVPRQQVVCICVQKADCSRVSKKQIVYVCVEKTERLRASRKCRRHRGFPKRANLASCAVWRFKIKMHPSTPRWSPLLGHGIIVPFLCFSRLVTSCATTLHKSSHGV